MTIRKRYIWATLLLLYVAAVAYLCFMKPDGLPKVRPDLFGLPIDKVVHFLMFFPYPIVAYGTFRGKDKRLLRDILTLLLTFITGIGLAVGTEHIQGLLGYRSEDINDFKADMLGIICSATIVFIYILTTSRQRSK